MWCVNVSNTCPFALLGCFKQLLSGSLSATENNSIHWLPGGRRFTVAKLVPPSGLCVTPFAEQECGCVNF